MRITSQNGFSGIDERVELQSAATHASVIENFYITDSGSLARRPKIRTVKSFGGQICGIWSGNIGGEDMLIVASNGALYRIPPNDFDSEPELLGAIGDGDCLLFEFNGILYIKTNESYHKYDGTEFAVVEGYIPTVVINCGVEGGGETFEQINLICDKRRQLVSPDGNSTKYKLVEDGVAEIVSVFANGKDMSGGYLFDSETGYISFINAPAEGLNTLEIVYRVNDDTGNRDRILRCNRIMLFGGNSDGRAFLWGNPRYPNYRFHSDLANGVPSVEYFPVNAFTVIGNSRINCIVQQYDRQLIFTKNEAFYSYSELRTDALGNVYSSFPVFSLNGSKGCLFETEGCVIDNRPVTLCEDGLNLWESTSVLNEKNAVCFSQPIKRSIGSMMSFGLENPKMFDFQAKHELYFVNAQNAYVYNYGNGAWYIYTDFKCEYYSVYGSTLYMSFGDQLYMMQSGDAPSDADSSIWKSAYLTNGQNDGLCDIIGFCADVYIKGSVEIKFGFENENGKLLERVFSFPEDEDRFCRISFRPSLKRTMPFRLSFDVSGQGDCVLHGVSIKTREKERSRRYGIL